MRKKKAREPHRITVFVTACSTLSLSVNLLYFFRPCPFLVLLPCPILLLCFLVAAAFLSVFFFFFRSQCPVEWVTTKHHSRVHGLCVNMTTVDCVTSGCTLTPRVFARCALKRIGIFHPRGCVGTPLALPYSALPPPLEMSRVRPSSINQVLVWRDSCQVWNSSTRWTYTCIPTGLKGDAIFLKFLP